MPTRRAKTKKYRRYQVLAKTWIDQNAYYTANRRAGWQTGPCIQRVGRNQRKKQTSPDWWVASLRN